MLEVDLVAATKTCEAEKGAVDNILEWHSGSSIGCHMIEGSNDGQIWGSDASWTLNLGGGGSRSTEGYGLWSVRSG